MSKAQKYSRNNNWKNFKKKIFFFQQKVCGKKSRILPKNTKKDPLGLLNVFTKRKLQQTVPFDRIQKFSEKYCKVPKKTAKGDPLVSPLLLEAKIFFGLVRDSNPRPPAFQIPENPGEPLGKEVEQMNKKVDRSR